MKVKPTRKRGRVLVEVGRQDESLFTRGAGEPARPAPFALRRILVPVDFSECSRKALEYAIPLARQFHSTLLLVYVMPVHYVVGSEFGPVDVPLPEAELRQNCERELQRLADRNVQGAVPVEIRVGRGQPVHELVRLARDGQVDLILLSTHGHTGLKHVLLGSVTENVVRYAPCPVLVVREHQHEFLAGAAPAAAPA
jgi:nucleotide-binding universal stress UspA family protein